MQSEAQVDVPSPIDFRRMSDARAWADEAMVKRPWRELVFSRIIGEIARHKEGLPSILELGSGPGFLAQRLLEALPQAAYAAADFSPAMHALARDRLGLLANRVHFLEIDFKSDDWCAGLPIVDVVVTVQAVHELRHKCHAPRLFEQIRRIVEPAGLFLMCDHIAGEGGMTNRSLYMTIQEHRDALTAGGFTNVELLLEERSLALFRGTGRAA